MNEEEIFIDIKELAKFVLEHNIELQEFKNKINIEEFVRIYGEYISDWVYQEAALATETALEMYLDIY